MFFFYILRNFVGLKFDRSKNQASKGLSCTRKDDTFFKSFSRRHKDAASVLQTRYSLANDNNICRVAPFFLRGFCASSYFCNDGNDN